MNREEAISSLKHLLDTNKLLYKHERVALEYVIKELTAQEVPVQEQSTDWIKKLAKEISIYLPTHDILSK